MLNDYKSTAQNLAAVPKVALIVISIQITYDTPMKLSLLLKPTYGPIMWSVGWWNGYVKGIYFITVFDN